MSTRQESVLRLWIAPALVWVALLVLLGITVGGSYVPLGAFNTALGLIIAAIKAALVFVFFMHLNRSSPLLRLAAAAGLFWLAFLFSLSFADYLTRPWNGGSTSLVHHGGSENIPPQPHLPFDRGDNRSAR